MKILIAEDNVVFRRILETNLVKWGYEIVTTQDGLEAWAALHAENAPQLAILDWMMPGLTGVELCRKIRQERKEPYTYIILLTAKHGEDELVMGMEAGADDYITKPFRPAELKVRLRAGRRIIELQQELITAREMQRLKATRDPLTNLWNHAEIHRLLDLELFRAEREKTPIGVIMADLDHFKAVNDTHGHRAGDVVLRLVAQRMQAMIRPYDYLGRYGGEEFLFVLPGCEQSSAVAFAERVRRTVAGSGVDTSEGLIPVTLSMGVAVGGAGSRVDVAALVGAADAALYRAKNSGRNRVEAAGAETENGTT